MTPGISPADRSGRTPPTGSGNQQGDGIGSATPSARMTQASSEDSMPQGNPISSGAMSPSPSPLVVPPPQRNPFLRTYERMGARPKTTNRRTGKQAGSKHTKIDMPNDDNKKNKGTGSRFPFKRLTVGAMVLAGGAAARYLMSSPGGGIGGGGSGGNGLIPGGNDLGRHGPDFGGGVGGGAEGGVETGGDSGNLGADELFPMPTSTQTADDAALGAAWLDAAGAGGGGRGHRRNRRSRRETVHEMPTPQQIRGGIPINNRGSTKGLASVEMEHSRCSGILISPHHVATAQHCVTIEKRFEGSNGNSFLGFTDPKTIKVRFPQGNLRTQVRTHNVPRYYFRPGFFPDYRKYTVQEFANIEGWRPNDLAILEIDPPVRDFYDPNAVYPYTQMANSTVRQKAIDKCKSTETEVQYFVQGFGLVRDGDDSDIAREMRAMCIRAVRDGVESFFTYSNKPEESTQPGDSGGPLLVQTEDGGRYSIGVATHGDNDGVGFSASFNYHQDFIASVINDREAGQAVVGCIRVTEEFPWMPWDSMSTVTLVNECGKFQTAHVMIGTPGDRSGGTVRLPLPRFGSRQRFSKDKYKPLVVYSTYRDRRPKTTRPPTTTAPTTTPGTTTPTPPTSPPTTLSPFADRDLRVGVINSAPDISANMTVAYDLNGNHTEISTTGVATNTTAEAHVPRGAANITVTVSPGGRQRLNPNAKGWEKGNGEAQKFDDYCYELTDANLETNDWSFSNDDSGSSEPSYEITLSSDKCEWLTATTAETLTNATTPFSGNSTSIDPELFNITTRVTPPPENTTVTLPPGIEDMSGSGEGSGEGSGSGSDESTFADVLLTTRNSFDISSRVTATPENTRVTQATTLFRNNTTPFRNNSTSGDRD